MYRDWRMTTDRQAAIRFIVCLGLVSLFADMTYEGAYSGLGPFLTDLGVSAAAVGFISGLGEMMAASLRYFSGKLADRTHAYWTIVIFGYLLNLLAIPALAYVSTWQMAALLVVAERTGKALRGPARDVLLSEATSTVGHGWGFGLHAAMDQTGAVVGPLIVAFIVSRDQRFGPAFRDLAIPAALALSAILLARHFRPNKGTPPKAKPAQPLTKVFWIYVMASGVLATGFLDFTLLGFHFEKTHLFAKETIPYLYAGGMGVVGLTALVCGRLFDRHGILVLSLGILVTMLALPLGFLGGPIAGAMAVACWAAGLGVQDATLRSGIAQVVSMNKRGTAFGAFNGVFGVMWFLGSVVMGLLYDHSLVALVVFGLLFQVASAVMFYWLRGPLAEAAAAEAATH
jgi:MFS family permease